MSTIKPIIVFVLASALTLGLTSCSLFDGKQSEENVTEEIVVKESLINPTTKGSSVPVSVVTFDNNVELQIFFAGTGYPNENELIIADTGQNVDTEIKLDAEGNVLLPEVSVTLVKEKRVVAAGYVLTNNSDIAFKLKDFSWGSATSTIGELKTVSTDLALHSMLGYAGKPKELTVNPDAELQPGQSASWGADIILPVELNGNDKIELTQIFNLNENQIEATYVVNAKDNANTRGQEIRVEPEEK